MNTLSFSLDRLRKWLASTVKQFTDPSAKFIIKHSVGIVTNDRLDDAGSDYRPVQEILAFPKRPHRL